MPNNNAKDLQHLPENVREFWEEKQREFGEKLLKFSYAALLDPARFPCPEKSGLCYVMERHLYFEDFPKASPFFLMNVEKYKKTLIQIPLQAVVTVELLKLPQFEEKFFGRQRSSGVAGFFQWFRPIPAYLVVSAQREAHALTHYVFRDLDTPDAWLTLLQSALRQP